MPSQEPIAVDPLLLSRVGNARTGNDAMRELGEGLRRLGRPVDRASLRRVSVEEGWVEFVGVWWSRGLSNLEEGLRIPIESTSFGEVMRTRQPVLGGSERHPPLLDHILEQEGVRSWVTVGLWEGLVATGLLSLSSVRSDAFGPEDFELLEEVGAALSDTLLGLVGPSRHPRQG